MAIILASIHLFGVRFQVKTNLKCIPALFLFSKYTELHFFSTTFLLPQPAILQFFFQSIKINLNESVFTTWFLLLSVSLISQLNCRLNVNWICFRRSRLIVRLRYWWSMYLYLYPGLLCLFTEAASFQLVSSFSKDFCCPRPLREEVN